MEYRPGSAGCHELLDRAALFTDMLERHLLAHPACVAQRGAGYVHAVYEPASRFWALQGIETAIWVEPGSGRSRRSTRNT